MHVQTEGGEQARVFRSLTEMPSWRRTLAIMVAVQFCAAMGFSIIFPFLPLYVKRLGSTTGWSTETLSGLVFSVQALTMAIASPFWGVVADRFGRKLMVMRATLGGAVVILLMGFVTNVEQLVALRAVQGLLTGVIAAANALVASVAPRERTGYAMGLLQVGLWRGVHRLVAGSVGPVDSARSSTSAVLLFSSERGRQDPFVRHDRAQPGSLHFLQDWARVLSNARLDCTLGLRFLVATGRAILEPLLPLFVALLAAESVRVGTLTGLIVGASSAASIATSLSLGRLGDRIATGSCSVRRREPPYALRHRVVSGASWLQTLTGARQASSTSLSALLARRGAETRCV
jgi:DHA1 family multidrug resistance protein-like MFS transporter